MWKSLSTLSTQINKFSTFGQQAVVVRVACSKDTLALAPPVLSHLPFLFVSFIHRFTFTVTIDPFRFRRIFSNVSKFIRGVAEIQSSAVCGSEGIVSNTSVLSSLAKALCQADSFSKSLCKITPLLSQSRANQPKLVVADTFDERHRPVRGPTRLLYAPRLHLSPGFSYSGIDGWDLKVLIQLGSGRSEARYHSSVGYHRMTCCTARLG